MRFARNRRINPKEIAALVAFLLSSDAAAITGQEIAISGGASLSRIKMRTVLR